MKEKIFIGFVLSLIAVLVAAPVLAAWGGEPDGDQHPMVGALYFDWDANGEITDYDLTCSGSYAGVSKDGKNDVFLTAGHCLAFTPSIGSPPAYVSFDNDTITGGVSGVIVADRKKGIRPLTRRKMQ